MEDRLEGARGGVRPPKRSLQRSWSQMMEARTRTMVVKMGRTAQNGETLGDKTEGLGGNWDLRVRKGGCAKVMLMVLL